MMTDEAKQYKDASGQCDQCELMGALEDIMPLLESVEGLLGDDSGPDRERIEQVRAALAKAGKGI